MASWACQTEGHADLCIIAVAVGEVGVNKQLLRWLEHSGSLIGIRLFMKYCYLLWKTKFFFSDSVWMYVQNELHCQVLHLLSFVLSSLPITAMMPRVPYIFVLHLKHISS